MKKLLDELKECEKCLTDEIPFLNVYSEKHELLEVPMGINKNNENILIDLEKYKNMIVIGPTGAGKSVFANSIICSLLLNDTNDNIKFAFLDSSIVEFSAYNKIKKLLFPTVINPDNYLEFINKLEIIVSERINILRTNKCNSIKDYNERFNDNIYELIIMIDDFYDMIDVVGKEARIKILDIIKNSKNLGIHLILFTDTPTNNTLTKEIINKMDVQVLLPQSPGVGEYFTTIDFDKLEDVEDYGTVTVKMKNAVHNVMPVYISEDEITKIINYFANNK